MENNITSEELLARTNKHWEEVNMKSCKACGKRFCIAGYNLSEYLYKVKRGGKIYLCCSYSCWNQASR